MRKQIVSTALALCLCASAVPNAHALGGASLPREIPSAASVVPYESGSVPTYQEAYKAMAALEAKYPDGMEWTDDTPYSDSNLYRWKGGPLNGQNIVATGCVAFAFELSDAAFGSLPARMLSTGAFAFSDVKVGDILRVNGDTHTVIVLQVSGAGVVIAEGNNAGKVRWGRALSRDEVEAASHYITRYPEGYVDPGDPAAGEVLASGRAGELAWTLTKAGTLTLSGRGAVPDVSGPDEQPWHDYGDRILEIVAEEGVTGIGSSAFYGCGAIGVTLPGSVTAIGASAFRGTPLVSVEIPAGVKTIGDDAFRGCANLASATLAEGVESIGQRAFYGCKKLESVILPASVGEVGAAAFMSCEELRRVEFSPGSSRVQLGDNLFTQCWRLAAVTLPREIDRIGEGMFQVCLSLTGLTIPQGAESIGGQAFASCGLLASVTIPDSVTSIGTAAFASCGSLRDIYFGGSEAQWNSIAKMGDVPSSLEGVTIHFDSPDPDPDPGPDPGPDPDPDPGPDPDPDPGPDPDPDPDCPHDWVEAWSSSATHHWHECALPGCPVTDNSQKDGYAAHVYSGSRDKTCDVCGYVRRVSGGGSSSGGGSGGSIVVARPSSPAAQNPNGPTTTRTEDRNTGTVVETTKYPDGSRKVVETRRDHTVITTETDASGRVKAEVVLSEAAVREAQRGGAAAVLPIPEVRPASDASGAPAVTVRTGSGEPVKVEIPASPVTPGTVAVLVGADGSERVVRTSVPTENGVAALLPDGAAVKLAERGKRFLDVPASHWASGAAAFVSARDLFAGTAAETFSPEAPMTRAMLMTVLARYDGVDTGGAVWYEKGMNWAVANAVSDGSNPDGRITREQLITMLWRYAGSPAAGGTLDAFTDTEAVGGYAREALCWAVENGIINGFGDGSLAPKGQTSRAEVAAVLMRYCLNA